MKNLISVEESAPIVMRDGTILRADIYRPADNNRHPAILMRTPYERQRSINSSYLNIMDTVSAGYAFIVQNIRGTYDSGGKWEEGDVYSLIEGPDGFDSVEFIADEKWCDGNVGTAGVSYCGNLQWILAKEKPPHLKAIAPWSCGTAGQAETFILTGTIDLAGLLSWAIHMGLANADKMEKEGKDVSHMRQLLNQATENPEAIYSYLPLKDVPCFDFEGVRDIWVNRVLNPVHGPEYLEKGRPDYSNVTVPCFHISGWYDYFTWGTFRSFAQMQNNGGSRAAREGQHILVGPWGHLGPLSDMGAFGAIDFGINGGWGANLSSYNITFFDKYVRGMNVDLPVVRYFVMGRNKWQEADKWPLPQTEWQRYYLHSKGHANTSEGDGYLNGDKPGSEPEDIFIYNPHMPVPTTGRRGRESIGFVAGPLEQSPIEKRHDVLCFSTPRFSKDTEITGPLEFHLYASTTACDTDFCAKVCDVYPDGRSFNVATGIIRARYRNSLFEPELVKPGEINEYIINLGNVSQVFKKGHQIRIDINSSNFPEWDRNMNTGNHSGEDSTGIVAMQTIYHISQYASYIDLPIIP